MRLGLSDGKMNPRRWSRSRKRWQEEAFFVGRWGKVEQVMGVPRRFVVFLALVLLGGVMAYFLVGAEMRVVTDHGLSFPEANLATNSWGL